MKEERKMTTNFIWVHRPERYGFTRDLELPFIQDARYNGILTLDEGFNRFLSMLELAIGESGETGVILDATGEMNTDLVEKSVDRVIKHSPDSPIFLICEGEMNAPTQRILEGYWPTASEKRIIFANGTCRPDNFFMGLELVTGQRKFNNLPANLKNKQFYQILKAGK